MLRLNLVFCGLCLLGVYLNYASLSRLLIVEKNIVVINVGNANLFFSSFCCLLLKGKLGL